LASLLPITGRLVVAVSLAVLGERLRIRALIYVDDAFADGLFYNDPLHYQLRLSFSGAPTQGDETDKKQRPTTHTHPLAAAGKVSWL